MRVVSLFIVLVFASVFAAGCAQPSSPVSPTSRVTETASGPASGATAPSVGMRIAPSSAGRPEYSPAYYNGTVVTMNEIEVPQSPGALIHAAADFYAVVYPPNHALWPATPPQCNPCDHNGNGTDLPDFHDHVLDSIPADPGHGEFNPLWHIFVILPSDFSPATQAAYAARLPMTSEAAVDAAIAAGVAREVDTGSYFVCSIVNPHAAP
jgi:hypothetical protein